MPLGKGFTMQAGSRLDHLLTAGYALHADASSYTLPKLVVKAITNDTIATMIASTQNPGPSTTSSTHAYSQDTSASKADTVMGLIVATGMNAAIALPLSTLSPHKTSNLTLPVEPGSHDDKHKILINIELGINGSAPPLRSLRIITNWDEFVDAKSAAPGFQPLEYMTSGRYLGELVRVIFVDYMTTECGVEVEDIPPRLRLKGGGSLSTEYLSTVVAVASSPRQLAQERLQVDFPPAAESSWTWTSEYAEALITIAHRVQIRSSRLIAAASIGLLLCSGDIRLKGSSTSTNGNGKTHHEPRELTIAYSGAVIEKYPMYLATCQETIDALFFSLCQNEDSVERIVLRHVEEGGLFGAAVLAAVEVGKEKDATPSA
jgi:hexokinase